MEHQLSLFGFEPDLPQEQAEKKVATTKKTSSISEDKEVVVVARPEASSIEEIELVTEEKPFVTVMPPPSIATVAETEQHTELSAKVDFVADMVATAVPEKTDEREEDVMLVAIIPTEEESVEEMRESSKLISKKGRKSFKEIDEEVDLIQIPKDEVLYKKQYYSISQVAKWFRVNNSLIRFWENEFDILKPRKNRKGDRLFRPEDVKNLEIIYYLLRQKKYTIDGARKYLKENKKTVDVQMQLVQSLSGFRSFLLELKANAD